MIARLKHRLVGLDALGRDGTLRGYTVPEVRMERTHSGRPHGDPVGISLGREFEAVASELKRMLQMEDSVV